MSEREDCQAASGNSCEAAGHLQMWRPSSSSPCAAQGLCKQCQEAPSCWHMQHYRGFVVCMSCAGLLKRRALAKPAAVLQLHAKVDTDMHGPSQLLHRGCAFNRAPNCMTTCNRCLPRACLAGHRLSWPRQLAMAGSTTHKAPRSPHLGI